MLLVQRCALVAKWSIDLFKRPNSAGSEKRPFMILKHYKTFELNTTNTSKCSKNIFKF